MGVMNLHKKLNCIRFYSAFIAVFLMLGIILQPIYAKAQTSLSVATSIANGLKLCDAVGASATFCVDITVDRSNSNSESASFSSGNPGDVSTGGSVSGSEHVKLDYNVATVNAVGNPTQQFVFDALTLRGIYSLTDGFNAFSVRDAYTFVKAGDLDTAYGQFV